MTEPGHAVDTATALPADPPETTSAGGPFDVELRNVTLLFPRPDGKGTLPVYENFDLAVEPGSFTVLLGPSGCGKSTLLNIVDGLLAPAQADTLKVLGRDLRTDPDVTRQCAYVFQNARLLKWKTLRGNVEFGLRGLKVQPKARWAELMDRYFGVVGLRDFMDYYPHQVSGGMQQRAAIVRAFVNEPRILLMDEPFSHLDEITAAELRRELVRLWTQDAQRRTVMFVTHDISEAVQLGQRIIVLTPRPATICHEEIVDLPYPRFSNDERVFAIEQTLRTVLAERAGVQV
ncbi:MAG TPA: ABC transporter ATP-binding protein [Candidatus Saccharimonadales bacterium]|nr:ABC transporter ATP-binding protein [Candidatus Saccharimonadales bacterium]